MSRRVKLLVTISDFTGGGAERELANLLAILPRDQYDIKLCLWRKRFDYLPPSDLPVIVLNKTKPWHISRVIRRLARVVDDWRPDLVYSQLPYVSIATGTALGLSRWRPRWICRLAGNPFEDVRFPLRSWARWSLARANIVAGCCEGVTSAISEHLRIDDSKTTTLWNVVDVERIKSLAQEPPTHRSHPNRFTIANAGRLVPQKNQQLLLRAFAKLPEKESELWLMGKGPLRRSLEHLAQQLGILSRVRFLGFEPNPYALFKEADCFVLSSHHEGLPNVLIEAQVCGKPVISTRCPYGPEELISDGETGLLADVAAVESLTHQLHRLATNPPLRRKLEDGCLQQSYERFHSDHVFASYEQAFEMAVGQLPRKSPALPQLDPGGFPVPSW